MSPSRTRPRSGGLARHWPLLAVLILVSHLVLHGYLQSRPGHAAMAVFIVAPKALFALAVLAIGMAARDVLHGGWRRILRGTALFPMGALVGSCLLALLTYRVYPSSHDTQPVPWCLGLPLEGNVGVLQGGRTADANAHASMPSQRYAYDLTVVRGDTSLQNGDPEPADDYAADHPILAPIDGVVVAAVDGQPRQSSVVPAWWPGPGAHGNYIVLQVDEGAFLVLARLRAGSIRVRRGDHVRAGATIGRVGDSGRSGPPYLHLHVQDSPVPRRGEAIPADFCAHDVIEWGASWDTARSVERGMPTGGDRRQIIRPARTGSP